MVMVETLAVAEAGGGGGEGETSDRQADVWFSAALMIRAG